MLQLYQGSVTRRQHACRAQGDGRADLQPRVWRLRDRCPQSRQPQAQAWVVSQSSRPTGHSAFRPIISGGFPSRLSNARAYAGARSCSHGQPRQDSWQQQGVRSQVGLKLGRAMLVLLSLAELLSSPRLQRLGTARSYAD